MAPKSQVLTRTRFILVTPKGHTKGRDARQIFFTYAVDGEGSWADFRPHELQMAKDVWKDMGSPAKITVTIEPGDKLNEEEADV